MSDSLELSRRTLLRGLGTAVALPMLDAMLPRSAIGANVRPGRREIADSGGLGLCAQRRERLRLDAGRRTARITRCRRPSSCSKTIATIFLCFRDSPKTAPGRSATARAITLERWPVS